MESKTFLKTLSIMHGSLCIGLIFFGVMAYKQNGAFQASVNYDLFIFLVPIVAMLGYFGSKWVFQNLIQKLSETEKLSTKLQRYYRASLIKYAMIEAGAFLALFAYYMNGTAMHLVIALSLLIYLVFQRPTKEKLLQEVPLSLDEKKEFDTL